MRTLAASVCIAGKAEAAELASLDALVAPNYAAVIESYQKAQEVARASR